jgi:aspartyl-tRNA(Asn)/glutamyl-tRNA(Gln) amidotransferase subunit A
MDKKFTIKEIQQRLEKKEFSCQDLVQECFSNIKKDKLNDFISLFEKRALEQAKVVDKKLAKGEKLKEFEGIPVAIKDNILIKGEKNTAASKMLENYIAPYNAWVIDKLREKDVIFLGKTNLDEFAMGASNETSYFGPVSNPHDKTRVPGGSSGGSAAAVAAQHCVFALGSDTGGSIRQPAAFCGVVGFKPSYGRVSRNGLMALSSSLDQIGPLTNSVEDAALVFNSILEQDQDDMTNVESEKINIFKLKDSIKNKIIGFPKDYYELSIDQEIKDSFKDTIQKLKETGIKTKEIDLSFMDVALAVYYIIQPAEASTNLARYDGIRYGFNKKGTKDLSDFYLTNRDSGFGKEVKRRIIIGTYVLSEGYRDAYYNTAKKVQADIKFRFQEIFKDIDAIILPTTPSTAFKLNEKFNDPLTMYLADIFTVAVNIAGLPAISLPMSKRPLPIGLQVIGNFMDEGNVLNIAYNLEQNFRFTNN